MQYISTRSKDKSASKRSFSQILLEGLAPDGGLYMPESYPVVTGQELDKWRSLSYAELAFEILGKFADDIPEKDLKMLAEKTYTPEVYRNVRSDDALDAITPLRLLEEKDGRKLMLLGLSNGPTLAFKDMAMQLLGNLFEYELKRQHAELNLSLIHISSAMVRFDVASLYTLELKISVSRTICRLVFGSSSAM